MPTMLPISPESRISDNISGDAIINHYHVDAGMREIPPLPVPVFVNFNSATIVSLIQIASLILHSSETNIEVFAAKNRRTHEPC